MSIAETLPELSYVLDMVETLVELLDTHSPVQEHNHICIVLDVWVVMGVCTLLR